ncbi:MAG: HTH domain-containing protein [Desulfobacterales bacterium]
MKRHILGILPKNKRLVSRDFIVSTLGISRVSVRKQIRKLQKSNYKISVTPKGGRS